MIAPEAEEDLVVLEVLDDDGDGAVRVQAAVAMKSSLLEVQGMRFAPGRMKRENWPKT
jgi:hypothetical protein